MKPMIEIHFLNGRKRRIPESAWLAEGECMANVLDVSFEDTSKGLVLYYKHYEPLRPDMTALDAEPDPNGLPSLLYNDGYAVIVEPGDMRRVEKVFYEGQLELTRFSPAGELVNLHKVNSARSLYLTDQGVMNTRLLIAELFTAMRVSFMEGDVGFAKPDDIKMAVRADLGVPEAVLEECLDFQAAFALKNPAYAQAHGLPYVDADGVWHGEGVGGAAGVGSAAGDDEPDRRRDFSGEGGTL